MLFAARLERWSASTGPVWRSAAVALACRTPAEPAAALLAGPAEPAVALLAGPAEPSAVRSSLAAELPDLRAVPVAALAEISASPPGLVGQTGQLRRACSAPRPAPWQ